MFSHMSKRQVAQPLGWVETLKVHEGLERTRLMYVPYAVYKLLHDVWVSWRGSGVPGIKSKCSLPSTFRFPMPNLKAIEHV